MDEAANLLEGGNDRRTALFDAIEEQLGGKTPVRLKPRNRTPFNRERRLKKIANIEAHCARHPRDQQSKSHAATMAGKVSGAALAARAKAQQ